MRTKIIFGPPGTGKTSYLLNILEQELGNYGPSDIAYVSFTKEGAYQGRDRAIEKVGYDARSFPYFKTLHALAFARLKMSRGQVIDKHHYKLFSDKMGMNFFGYYTADLIHNDDRYLFFNQLHRNNKKTAAQYLYGLDVKKLQFVTLNYRKFKDLYNIYDFTDMIELFIKKRYTIPVKVAIIDEAQDLTTLQWRMVWTAFKDCERVYIAGDDDQAIYEWSGADVEYFLNIEGDIEILRRSFRLPENIVRFAKSISGVIENRVNKEYHGLKEPGEIIRALHFSEIEISKGETWMFLSRNHVFLKPLQQWLRDQGIVYSYNGEISASHRQMEAIYMYERMRKDQAPKGDIEDTIKLRSHLKKRINLDKPWYDNFNWKEEEIDYYRDLVRTKANLNECLVRVNTIHSVKGAEADNVVVLLDVTRRVSQNIHYNADSEYRVLYVGCTRVKRRLYIVESNSKYAYELPTRSWT